MDNIAAVADLIRQEVSALAPLYGLVLAGGQSTRMGSDKGEIKLHGKNQRDHLMELLAPYTEQQFISARAEQGNQWGDTYPIISDRLINMGPFGALISAFMAHPDAAWLVLAVDLPHFDERAILELVAARNPSAIATSYRSPVSGFPEPLAAIWEPKSYAHLLSFLAQGYSCPRKVLINSPHTEIIEPYHPQILANMNTPQDLADARKRIE
ncbi:MAG: NTP transferase domain-containing protein [Flavobacteriales bacterium]|nr:NTP transferase domain-containing protein [Flavobacteriales bacterium]